MDLQYAIYKCLKRLEDFGVSNECKLGKRLVYVVVHGRNIVSTAESTCWSKSKERNLPNDWHHYLELFFPFKLKIYFSLCLCLAKLEHMVFAMCHNEIDSIRTCFFYPCYFPHREIRPFVVHTCLWNQLNHLQILQHITMINNTFNFKQQLGCVDLIFSPRVLFTISEHGSSDSTKRISYNDKCSTRSRFSDNVSLRINSIPMMSISMDF